MNRREVFAAAVMAPLVTATAATAQPSNQGIGYWCDYSSVATLNDIQEHRHIETDGRSRYTYTADLVIWYQAHAQAPRQRNVIPDVDLGHWGNRVPLTYAALVQVVPDVMTARSVPPYRGQRLVDPWHHGMN